MLGAWVIDGNRKRPRDLGSLAKRYGVRGKIDIVSKLIKLGMPVRAIPVKWLKEYCHQDVKATYDVFVAQCKELSAQKQWHLVHTRNLCCAVLADIEFEGLTLDKEMVEEEYKKAVDMVNDLGQRLAVMTGGINLGSPKQLTTFLYDTLGLDEPRDHRGKPIRTEKGERTANAGVMTKLKPTTQAQKDFLDTYKNYNKAVSLLEKNLEYFKLTCDQKGGTFYGQIRQAVVQTGRLASAGIPVKF